VGDGPTQWTLHTDGKYYYNSVLDVNGTALAKTLALFTHVKLKDGVTELTDDKDTIEVSAELIQAEYLKDVPETDATGNPAIDAFYWYENPPAVPGGGV
jgi:hypothetical protein